MAENSELDADVREMKSGGGWMVGLGILTLLFGMFAIGSPAIAGVSVAMVVGAMVMASGLFQIIHGFAAVGWKGKLFEILIGILALVGGAMILSRPMTGMMIGTIFLAAYFVADGIVSIAMAFKLKPEKGWGWVLFSGIVSFLLGFMLWRQWPLSATWAIGVIFGVKMLMAGWSMILFGSVTRGIAKGAEEGMAGTST